MRNQACVRRAALAVIVSISAFAASDMGSAADTVKRGGTLAFARPDEPLTFDPFVPNDNGSIYALEQVCDSLVEADSTGRGLRPGLAESWDISGDGLTYTFKIRDAKFSNGDPVTVDDVVFSLKSLADPQRSMSFILKPVKSVEAVSSSVAVPCVTTAPATASSRSTRRRVSRRPKAVAVSISALLMFECSTTRISATSCNSGTAATRSCAVAADTCPPSAAS